MKKIGLYSFILIGIDQLIKYLITATLSVNEVITIIHDFFSITYLRNTGAAFSILEGNRLLLIVVGLLAINLIYMFLIRGKQLSKLEQITYGILLGGIIGNLIDRMIYGYVIDYFSFQLFTYRAPVFNFADVCIIMGASLIILSMIKEEFHENIHRRRKR